jgi:GT2 family glycosyltransferase
VITLLVMTDGRRDYLPRAVESFDEYVTGPVTRRVLHDDSGDPNQWRWLREQFPQFELVTTKGRAGFGGAIQSAWAHLTVRDTNPYIFHLEDDFVFQRPVHLHALLAVLQDRPYLIQLALRRQPWNAVEADAGGVVESHPDAYTEHTDPAGHRWLEHRLFFTTNPSLYRRDLCRQGWPDGDQSEGHFGQQILQAHLSVDGIALDPDRLAFGFWGPRDSGEWVQHIGKVRAGHGY